jgi:hypothetical protein
MTKVMATYRFCSPPTFSTVSLVQIPSITLYGAFPVKGGFAVDTDEGSHLF